MNNQDKLLTLRNSCPQWVHQFELMPPAAFPAVTVTTCETGKVALVGLSAETIAQYLIGQGQAVLSAHSAVKIIEMNVVAFRQESPVGFEDQVYLAFRIERGITERRQGERRGGAGQEGGQHYASKIDPWELQRSMQSSGNAFVDARRGDVLKYAWRMKGEPGNRMPKLLEDLKKAKHCVTAAIEELEAKLKTP